MPGLRVPVGFGAEDRLSCVTCAGTMDLVRRAPHPLHGMHSELQTFVCSACSQPMQRSVDARGASMGGSKTII